MIKNIIELDDGITEIRIDFIDEGIDLQGRTTIKGDEEKAEKYVEIFANDLKQNNIELFPEPTKPEHPEEDEELMM